ncbi:MAG: hypothetical protein L7H00_00390 [Vulcanisaeta sp.]|nr:hypothetical protein [Vulcanisaeta sp.]MCG2891968.1 hypothetical protein [Vulcanisaeta sp.]MCG2895200.1 hypothetical protein [Vulcanisaeta sp.]
MPISLLLNGQVRVGGVESAYVEVSEFRRAYVLQSHPCQCKSLVDTDKVGNEGVLIGELVYGTIEWALEVYKDADKVRVPLSIIAARSVDGSIICIYPDCVCRALQRFTNMAPSDSKRALVNVVFVDDNRYNPRSHRDSEKLKALAAKYCAMSDDARLDALMPVIEDTVVMLALNNGELREKIINWLKPGVPGDVPPEVTGALVDALNIGRRSASRALKHIYVTRRAYILDKLRPVISTSSQSGQEVKDTDQGTAGTGQQATAAIEAKSAKGSEVEDTKAEVKGNVGGKEEGEGDKQLAVIPCAETHITELIYDIFRELGISLDERGAEVGYLLCTRFTLRELETILKRVKSIKSHPPEKRSEVLSEVRRLLFSLDEDGIRAYFGLAVKAEAGAESGLGVQAEPVEDKTGLGAGSVEPEPVDIEEARESLVRVLEGLHDAGRYAKAVRGVRSELSRIIFEVLRASMPRKDPGTLQLIASTLAGLMLERPGVIMDIAELARSLDAGELARIIDAVKRAINGVAEAVRRARELDNKKLRPDEAAEEVRAAAGEIASGVCLGVEGFRDALLGIVYNAVSDKNLANTVRELLGKAVVTRCGAF